MTFEDDNKIALSLSLSLSITISLSCNLIKWATTICSLSLNSYLSVMWTLYFVSLWMFVSSLSLTHTLFWHGFTPLGYCILYPRGHTKSKREHITFITPCIWDAKHDFQGFLQYTPLWELKMKMELIANNSRECSFYSSTWLQNHTCGRFK